MSGILPVGAIAAKLRVTVTDGTANIRIAFRENGNSNGANVGVNRVQVANVPTEREITVAVDGARKIEYIASNTTWTQIDITVKAWPY